jgi:antirestriction protein ArdC
MTIYYPIIAMSDAPLKRHKRRKHTMKGDLYADVTTRILAELENGAAPWVKPWSATPGQNVPGNAISGRPYSGINVLLLWNARSLGYRTPRFLTFKQAIEAGGNVRKGEHGHKVVFVKQLRVHETGADGEDNERTVPMMREYTVFNLDQCEGLPEKLLNPDAVPARNKDQREALADAFMASTRADIREGHGEAFYRPTSDHISLPAFAAFKNADNFYSTAFHELGHWTAHKSRLDRDLRGRFGESAYAAEELVAELTSAFLCAEFSFDGDLRHAGYIESWSKLLRKDARAFFTAASKAQAAADYMRGLALACDAPMELAA